MGWRPGIAHLAAPAIWNLVRGWPVVSQVWTLRLVVASTFAFVFFFCAVFVPFAAMLTTRGYVVRGEDKHCSTTPLVGSIAGVVAVAVAPLASIGARIVWAWTPLVIELGVLVLVGLAWKLLRLDRK